MQLFEVGSLQNTIAAGDFDKDGEIDLVVGLTQQAQIAVLFNNNNNFNDVETFATGLDPQSITVADLDFDQDLDIATADTVDDQISVLINVEGDFDAINLAGQNATTAIVSADFNNDGVADLVNNILGLDQLTVLVTFP